MMISCSLGKIYYNIIFLSMPCPPPLVLKDGTLLYRKQWNEQDNLIGILYIIHGLGEHSGRYDMLAKRMISKGIRVHSIDLRGHGRTFKDLNFHRNAVKGHLGDINFLKDDIEDFLQIDIDSIVPKFLLGHSLGGLAVLDFISSKRNHSSSISGVIASAPGLALPNPINRWKERLGRFIGSFLPSLYVGNGLDYKMVSRDNEYCMSIRDDPLLHHGITLETAATFLDLGKEIMSTAGERSIDASLLISHGTGDVFTCHKASESFISLINCHDKRIKLYQDAYHNLHQDLIRDRVIEDYYDWMMEIINK